MRILMLSWEFPPHLVGGLGAHVGELAPALAAQGVDVTVITPRWKGGAHVEQLNAHAVVYRVDPPVHELWNYYADAQQTNLTLEQLGHELWEQGGGFDLIHAHDWLVSFAAEALKKLHKAPLVATMHATERGRGGGQLNGDMAKAIDGAEWWLTYEAWRVITASRFMAEEVCKYFELPWDKVRVIPNGVDPARFAPQPGVDLQAFRRKWALPEECLVFFIGRIQSEKGVPQLIESARRMLHQGANVKFVIAGKGELLTPLRDQVAAQGLSDRILLAGHVSDQDRDRLFLVADVAVFPSLYEPFGIVALEAMAAKCPVIVSDAGGLGEVVENRVTGIVVPSGNVSLLVDALVDALYQVLQHPDQARGRAERAYEIVRREYSWEHIARATIDLYEEVIRGRGDLPWD